MTTFFERLFNKYPVKSKRILEFLPGLIAWIIISAPLWGAFLIPQVVAYFILFFDVYWFYKSFAIVYTLSIASRKIKIAEKDDWNEKVMQHQDSKKVSHILIIPNYGESLEKLRHTLHALTKQTVSHKQLYVVLAMEEREATAKHRAETLIHEFKSSFGEIFATFHPDVIDEVKGKSSNEAYAGRTAYERLFVSKKLDINFATVTSIDADAIFDPQYYAYLTYVFLTDPKPHNKFWQSAIVFYNNLWKVPSPVRVVSFFSSLWRIALLVQGDRLITHSTYSLSFRLLKEVDFWDVDVIPEDYRIFFKAFYRKAGQIWVEPIFLKTSLDAVQSTGYLRTLKSKYQQERRWSWGVSDEPLFIKWWLTVPNVPFFRKTVILYQVFLDHILWPASWFIITIAANVVQFINPIYSRTSLGYYLPKLAGYLLTFCLLAILALIIIDYKNNPEHRQVSKIRILLFPFEFILMPLIGFFLSALPALISHTQLMRGKRLEYKVTEKV